MAFHKTFRDKTTFDLSSCNTHSSPRTNSADNVRVKEIGCHDATVYSCRRSAIIFTSSLLFLGTRLCLNVFPSFSVCFVTLSDRWIFAIVRAANYIHRERAGDRKCTVGPGVGARSTCEKYRQKEQELWVLKLLLAVKNGGRGMVMTTFCGLGDDWAGRLISHVW